MSAGSQGERHFPDEMPLPAASAETASWWDAAAAHQLVVQRCAHCETARHPPGPVCPVCRSTTASWAELPGTGVVYTYTIVRQAFLPALADVIPYVVAAVEFDGAEGVRMVTNVVDIDPEEVEIGMPVEVVWEDMGPELALPRVRPVAGGDASRPAGGAS